MSIGNLKTEGGKGTNWPWQYKMLKGLQGIIDAITATAGEKENAPTMHRALAAGQVTIAASVKSISFYNASATDTAHVLTVDLKPGETVNFDAGGNGNKFPADAFTYDPDTTGGGAGDLLIIYVA